jgi:hypothetical protein
MIDMILKDEQRRGLEFIQAANLGGHRPTRAQVEQWMFSPGRRPGRRGKLIEPARPGTLALNLDFALSESVRTTYRSLVGTPAVYEPDGPPEGFVEHLLRLEWIEANGLGGLALTGLGRALLRSAQVSSDDQESLGTVVLGSEDPLAYGKLLGHIAESGEALVVDPYLRANQLLELLLHTNCMRLLVGSGLKSSDLTEMKVLLNTWGERPGVQLRQAARGAIHDRYIVGDLGVHMIGASINGIAAGSATTVLIPLRDAAADAIHTLCDEWWDAAELLAVSPCIADEGEDDV